MGGGDSSVVRAADSWLKGHGFESLLERRENFLLQGQLSVLTLIAVSTTFRSMILPFVEQYHSQVCFTLHVKVLTLQNTLFINPLLIILCNLHSIHKPDFTIYRAIQFASLILASHPSCLAMSPVSTTTRRHPWMTRFMLCKSLCWLWMLPMTPSLLCMVGFLCILCVCVW